MQTMLASVGRMAHPGGVGADRRTQDAGMPMVKTARLIRIVATGHGDGALPAAQRVPFVR